MPALSARHSALCRRAKSFSGSIVRHGLFRSLSVSLRAYRGSTLLFIAVLVSIAQVDRLERLQFRRCLLVAALSYKQSAAQLLPPI